MESEGSSSSLAGCQPGALEVVGSNPTDPIILYDSVKHGHILRVILSIKIQNIP